ncbi:unnamed protein product [Staurois parvus]|uniref:Uncharacterized protein n=1 Tax=Staurois parvus TaxID=386267 RepID=A0ABN9DMI2_9NEOB|nr:unnamed protein product [Staurois parvus]
MRPPGPGFARAREPIHLNGLPCLVTRREDVPARLWKMQPRYGLRFPVRVACH